MNLSSLFASKIFKYLLDGDTPALRRQAGPTAPLRPPWASAAEAFRSRCNSCGACAAACPRSIIALDEDGLPAIDFSLNFCIFCGECARSCPAGALRFEPEQPPWDICARIDENCLLRRRVLCRSCGERCQREAINFPLTEAQLPEVSAERCSGCGACGSICPVGAIFFEHRGAQ